MPTGKVLDKCRLFLVLIHHESFFPQEEIFFAACHSFLHLSTSKSCTPVFQLQQIKLTQRDETAIE